MTRLVRHFVFGSTASAVAEVVEHLVDASRQAGLDEQDGYQLSICVAELLNNIVLYAHKGRAESLIEFMVQFGSTQIEMLCLDQGQPFSPAQVLPYQDNTEPGGRGLPIIRAWCDEYRVEPRPGGNVHRLFRSRS